HARARLECASRRPLPSGFPGALDFPHLLHSNGRALTLPAKRPGSISNRAFEGPERRRPTQEKNAMSRTSRLARWSRLALVCSFLPWAAYGQTPAAASAGDTAWLLTATTLVLFMTLPGLAAFYSGLVRTK